MSRSLLSLILLVAFSPTLTAQEEEPVEIFWGDEEYEEEPFEEEEYYDEFGEEEYYEEDPSSEDLYYDEETGLYYEYDEETGEYYYYEYDEETDEYYEYVEEGDEVGFEEEFFEEEGGEELSDTDLADLAQRMGYSINLSGASPSFVNNALMTYNSGVDIRGSLEFPLVLQFFGTRFRLGAEVGTFKFDNYKPIGGTFSGVHITGIISFPAGPGQVKLGTGLIGNTFGVVAENSYGFSIGNTLDLRVGVRSTTAFGVIDDKKNDLGTVSWMDGLLILGINL